jgi:protein SCO1/2
VNRVPRVMALCALFAACSVAPESSEPLGGVEEHVGARLPLDTPFTSSHEQKLMLGDVVGRGKPVLLVMAYSRCSMLCSLVLRAAADAVPELGLAAGKDFSLVTISIDPRETPYEAGRTQELALGRAGYPGQDQVWPFLVGGESAIQRVSESLGFRYTWDERTEQYAHPAVLFVISPEGRIGGYFYDLRPDPALLRAALLGTRTPAPMTLQSSVLNCFRFDALGRKYGPVVQRAFQGGAASVALALGMGLIWLFRKERASR